MNRCSSVQELAISLDEETAITLAELFRTLGDGARILILAALTERERNVTELSEQAKLSESATSHHLRQMRLVKSRKEGRYVFYSLDDEHVKQLVTLASSTSFTAR